MYIAAASAFFESSIGAYHIGMASGRVYRHVVIAYEKCVGEMSGENIFAWLVGDGA